MPQPQDASPTPSRWLWLDHWLEPPWRALLTWVALAELSGWAIHLGTQRLIFTVVYLLFGQLDHKLSTPLPGEILKFALNSNYFILWFWFEPLVLRLNLLRGLAWLGLRVTPMAILAVFQMGDHDMIMLLVIVVSSLLGWLVLRGWRSRPWMAVIGGSIFAVTISIGERFAFGSRAWLWMLATALPYAAVLLYGTRLLRPEERERPSN